MKKMVVCIMLILSIFIFGGCNLVDEVTEKVDEAAESVELQDNKNNDSNKPSDNMLTGFPEKEIVEKDTKFHYDVQKNPNYKKLSYEEAKKILEEGGFTFDKSTPRTKGNTRLIQLETRKKNKDEVRKIIHQSFGVRGYQGVSRIITGVDILANEDDIVMLYSNYGEVSERATHALLNEGFNNVYDMGSVEEWKGPIQEF